MVEPRVGIFLEPLNSNDHYYSHIPILHLATYYIIIIGDVTEVDVYIQ